MVTLLESPSFALTHDPQYACLYATWQGHHNIPRTQAQYTLILQFVQSTHSKKLLNDTLLDQDGWMELTNWIAEDCFRHLTEQGLATVAWVLPRNPEALYAARKVLDKLEAPLVATFEDAEAAYKWLQEWPKHPREQLND